MPLVPNVNQPPQSTCLILEYRGQNGYSLPGKKVANYENLVIEVCKMMILMVSVFAFFYMVLFWQKTRQLQLAALHHQQRDPRP